MTEAPHETTHESREAPLETPKEAPATLLSNVLAIVGVVIVVILIIWGLVHLAGLAGPWFSSLFGSRSTVKIELSAPGTVTSGTPFTIQWSYAPTQAGSFALVYQCKDGLTFKTADTGALQIPCGTAFAIASSTDTISLVPSLVASSATQSPLTIVYIPTVPSANVEGTVVITVTPATKTTAQPSTHVSSVKPIGPTDLVARILSLSSDGYGNGVAVFDIENVGTNSSGTYQFEAQLPTNSYGQTTYYGAPTQGSYTYSSPLQVSLAPGEHIQSTLRFTGARTGGVFSVTVDPQESTKDTDRTNNYAYQTLGGTTYQPQPYYTY